MTEFKVISGSSIILPDNKKLDYRKIKEEHHGYSDTNNILYVVYNHERGSVGPMDHNVYIGP
jgi:hypothetical protein